MRQFEGLRLGIRRLHLEQDLLENADEILEKALGIDRQLTPSAKIFLVRWGHRAQTVPRECLQDGSLHSAGGCSNDGSSRLHLRAAIRSARKRSAKPS